MIWCGTAVRVISPKGPIHLAGYATRSGKPSNGMVHDDLYAKALYLKNDKTSILFISVDLCELSGAEDIQRRLSKATGAQHVLIAATHTHSGPYTDDSASVSGAFDPVWYEWYCEKMEEVAREAVNDIFEARIGVGQIDAPEIGKNRRPGCSVTDPALTLIKVDDLTGNVRALMLNYPCHCTILDGNSYSVSADYPGYLYRILGERYPQAQIIFTNGAAGDINIGYSSDASALGEPMSFRSFETAEKTARILSEKALILLPKIVTSGDCGIEVHILNVAFPLRKNRPSPDELLSRITAEDQQIATSSSPEITRAALLRKIYLQGLMYSLDLVGTGVIRNTQTLLVRIGSLILVSTPTELFCEIGLAIKQHIPPPLIGAIIGYAGGYIGYLPTLAAMQAGGYEAEVSPFANNAADVFIQATAEIIKTMTTLSENSKPCDGYSSPAMKNP